MKLPPLPASPSPPPSATAPASAASPCQASCRCRHVRYKGLVTPTPLPAAAACASCATPATAGGANGRPHRRCGSPTTTRLLVPTQPGTGRARSSCRIAIAGFLALQLTAPVVAPLPSAWDGGSPRLRHDGGNRPYLAAGRVGPQRGGRRISSAMSCAAHITSPVSTSSSSGGASMATNRAWRAAISSASRLASHSSSRGAVLNMGWGAGWPLRHAGPSEPTRK